MHSFIYNGEVIAIAGKEHDEIGSKYVEPYERFGTEYGLFIPLTLSAYQFIRWLRRGMRDELPPTSISAFAMHISNDGEVFTVRLSTEDNMIIMVPVTSKKFSYMHSDNDRTEAYSYLLKDCKSIAEAVKLLDDSDITGIFEPHFLFASDWVAHAKEKGYDKVFYHTRFYHN